MMRCAPRASNGPNHLGLCEKDHVERRAQELAAQLAAQQGAASQCERELGQVTCDGPR